ncbi:MAG: hypothetical protein LBG52_02450 [Candidatus Peribacteria bacterium]|jgi:hypothetical protein|nr:hypothetical protein [Candidatus Peribacteria bacterium]
MTKTEITKVATDLITGALRMMVVDDKANEWINASCKRNGFAIPDAEERAQIHRTATRLVDELD